MGARGDAGALRSLPAVHELADALDAPHPLAVAAARRAIEEERAAVLAGGPANGDLVPRARELLAELERPSLRRVLNATGVILHTNLGRAPLAASARDAVRRAAEGYSNLELDLASGERGTRHAHVEGLLCELTGAQAAIVVNNGAGAVLLAAAALAGPGRAIVVARGQLVEIGGGFRIPEVIAQSGARLVEVGTTNRTRIADYARALETHEDVAAIMRVHQSNFRTVGFVEDVPVEALCELGLPVIDDIGSGWLASQPALTGVGGADTVAMSGADTVAMSGADTVAMSGAGATDGEPPLSASVAAGAALVCCSGDKLLGGPQAGLMVGRSDAVAAARRHPLARALRIDKLSLAALEATLRLYREPKRALREIPALAMLAADPKTLAARSRAIANGIGDRACIATAVAKVGGGALPLLEFEGPAVALEGEPESLARALRAHEPPVIARIHDGRVLLDPRTLTDEEVPMVVRAVRGALEE
ncbi:MAG: L-seryl-tRNA(Sec) selenium transferase [Solirubrobacterales bacterium]|nr:L-seryl-tRNA(Sec) selenium transferase [Solirubrobacterales bacterium]